MPENRFFQDTPLQKGQTTSLQEEELRHLKVMRCKEGDVIELVNGQNLLAKAQITNLSKSSVSLHLIEVKTKPTPTKQVILAQSYLRPKNLDLVIEKGTELGATAFLLFPGDRSEKTSLSQNQLHRLRHLTISALKQCGRLDLPKIEQMPPLADWPTPPPGDLFFGDLTSSTPLTPTSHTTLFIGPEKGFSPEEENILHNTFHAKGIRLNPNILRAETAALCALSLSIS